MTDKSEDKKSFVMYADYEKHFNLLSLEKRGELITAIFVYQRTGEIPKLDSILEMAFSFIKETLDRDNEKWRVTKEERAKAGKKGGIASGESRRAQDESE